MMRHLTVGLLLLLAMVMTTPALATFQQSPMLDPLVANNDLPSVAERLPEQPFVVEPYESVGRYGGIARTANTAPEHLGDDMMLMSLFVKGLVRPNRDINGVIPHLAERFTVSDDATTFTFHLRAGTRWSDGEPLTAADIMFWYEDFLLNESLTPVIGVIWRAQGEVVQVRALDEYTVEFQFAGPKPFFLNQLVHSTVLMPKHYLTEFHEAYADPDELAAMVEEAGYEAWYQLFQHRMANWGGIPLRVGLPTLAAYKMTGFTSDRRIYERNPYYWKVDTAGNQLPYIDGIENSIVADREMVAGMVMSGQLDFAGFANDIRNYPLYREFEEAGNYRTILWETGMASDTVYMVNQTVTDPVLREIFQDARFRQALSLGIDRDEINEVIYFGRARPIQYTAFFTSVYYDEDFATSYAAYDPERANSLLDEMGLDQRDAEGYRMRPDGERLAIHLDFHDIATPKTPNVELTEQYWEDLGIEIRSRALSGELQAQRAPGNLMDMTLWTGDKATDILFPVSNNLIIPRGPGWDTSQWVLWGQYLETGGAAGEEPPANIVELRGWYEQMLEEPDEAVRLELGRKILASQAENLWVIGTVGRTPFALIANNDLQNVPDQGFWAWDPLWTTTRDPEQFYFDR